MKLGNNIKNLRKQVKLTQTELAERLGVTEQTVSKWETDKCYPDVSLLPMLANVFDCSVDRVLGIESETYGNGIEKALMLYSKCNSYTEEIAILLEALTKYPNNNELKLKLAHAYFMAWRVAEDTTDKTAFFAKAINCCEGIINCCKCNAERDKAYDLLVQIYAENGDFDKALQACNQLSSDSWKNKLVGTAQILKESKNTELPRYAQNSLFELQTAMRFICQLHYNSLIEANKYDEALLWCKLQMKILSLFDTDSNVLYLCEKMMLAFQTASIYKKTHQRDNLLKSLREMSLFAKKGIEKGCEHSFSENPILLQVSEKEPYMTENETKLYVNTFLDKFKDVLAIEELQNLKI